MYKVSKQRANQPRLDDKMRGDGGERSNISILVSSSSIDDHFAVIYCSG